MTDEIPVVTGCELCARLVACRKHIVNGAGRPSAKIMFVGQNPDMDSDEGGRPFLGKQGKLLRLLCDSAGISPVQVFRTNAVRCRAPGNAKPKKDEILNCRPFLLEEIKALNPNVIVALGEIAVQTLYSLSDGSEFGGELYDWASTCEALVSGWQAEVEIWNTLSKAQRLTAYPDGKPRKPKLPLKPKPPKATHTAVRDVAGHTLIQPDTGIPLIATYNPNFLIKNQWHMCELVVSHFEKARRVAERGEE